MGLEPPSDIICRRFAVESISRCLFRLGLVVLETTTQRKGITSSRNIADRIARTSGMLRTAMYMLLGLS
jgi:hypothetical protein